MSESKIEWATLLRAGLRGLGLKPWEFWALTPIELEMMLGQPSGVVPLKRSRLDQLLSDFPDTRNEV